MATSNPAQNLCEPVRITERAYNPLPSDRIDEAVRLACDAITNIRVNAIGRLADELIVEGFPAGQVYGYIAKRMTDDGDPTSWRSIQHWRLTMRNYKRLLETFPRLPRAAFALASEIAQDTAVDTEYILNWQDRDGDKSVPPYTCEQVKTHFLPAPDGYQANEWSGFFALLRNARHDHIDQHPRFMTWLAEGRKLISELLNPPMLKANERMSPDEIPLYYRNIDNP